MSQYYEQLESLLLQKDFDALSAQEQAWVQEHLSKEAYQYQRRLLLESTTMLTTPAPPPKNQLASLQKQLQQQHQKSIWDYFQTPIAFYQAALMAAVVGFIFWYLKPVDRQTVIKQQVVYQTQIDTFVQEKIVIQEKIIYKTKTITLPPKVDTIYLDFAEQPSYYHDKTITAPTKTVGKSLKETRKLMDFVMEAN